MTEQQQPGLEPETAPPGDVELIQELHRAGEATMQGIGQRIIGQRSVVEHLLIALFSKGHALFVGVPGLAKTLLIQTLAEVLDLLAYPEGFGVSAALARFDPFGEASGLFLA